jgi:dTDP-4-dehydrorhamnose reductase
MEKNDWSSKLEVWGGIECTINRLGDTFYDQLAKAGHYDRPEDIDRFVGLRLSAMRYPILWERHEPTSGIDIDWTWTARQLDRLRHARVNVIAGLVHHGSGPVFTELLDPRFPELLASYALKVAKRFPWITHYTPVNEPMTTARFSGLYGLWYPHHKSDESFLRMLIHQLKGTVLAMQAIRTINPDAQLVQTEDLGKTHSTERLRYQAEFENDRRWLTFDLLHGKVNRLHPLRRYLVDSGISQAELDFFTENPCEADCMGCNYYVTSERFLDETVWDHPCVATGGNGVDTYVDLEAVRVGRHAGLSVLLEEAWHRFGVPIAITEAHICCTREEQMRWLMEVWRTCWQLRVRGIDIRAVTAWALLGAFDWNSLLTKNEGVYESGVFDIRNDAVKPTALARMIIALSSEGIYAHPLLAQGGWWHYAEARLRNAGGRMPRYAFRPLLIIADDDTGGCFGLACKARNIPHVILAFAEINLCTRADWDEAILKYDPWGIIYAHRPDNVLNVEQCFQINVQAPGKLAAACEKHHLSVMTYFPLPHPASEAQPSLPAVPEPLQQADACSKILGASWVALRNPGAIVTWSQVTENYDPAEVLVPIHAALNLLIDDLPGTWRIDPVGVATRSQQDGPTRTAADLHGHEKGDSYIIYQYFRHFISGTLN